MQAIRQISEEKHISEESVIETIEAALAAAYRKDFGEKNQNIKVHFDTEASELAFDVFDVKTVVEDQELPAEEEVVETDDRESSRYRYSEPAPRMEGEEGAEKKFNPKTEIMITEARATLKPEAEIGEEIRTQLDVPAEFGRMAAQTAKQVIIQKIREAERTMLFAEFKEREHELVNATVQRREGRMVLIDLGKMTAILPPEEQIPTERYASGDRVKVYVTTVRLSTKGPEVIVSRAHPEIIRRLFTLEIPEVASGIVKIHAIAREAGGRSKVAVSSSQDNVDPIGSCIGQRGTRIQTVISEIGGEKIDVIQYDEDPSAFIMHALSPAKVVRIVLDQDRRSADVFVQEDQLSLAIGRGGQNVRLASKLTGWKLNIKQVDAPAGEVAASAEAEEEAPSAKTVSDDAAEEADVMEGAETELVAEDPDAAGEGDDSEGSADTEEGTEEAGEGDDAAEGEEEASA